MVRVASSEVTFFVDSTKKHIKMFLFPKNVLILHRNMYISND